MSMTDLRTELERVLADVGAHYQAWRELPSAARRQAFTDSLFSLWSTHAIYLMDLSADAARYRYLRDRSADVTCGPYIGIQEPHGATGWTCGEDADRHIDRAIEEMNTARDGGGEG